MGTRFTWALQAVGQGLESLQFHQIRALALVFISYA